MSANVQARMRCLQIFDEHAFSLPPVTAHVADAIGSRANACSNSTGGSSLVCDAVIALPAYLRHVGSSVAAQDLISLASRIWSAPELQQMSQRVETVASGATATISVSNELWSRSQFVHVCVELLPQFAQVSGAAVVPSTASVSPPVSTPCAAKQLASTPPLILSSNSSSTPTALSSFETLTDLGPPPHFSDNAVASYSSPSGNVGVNPTASGQHEAAVALVPSESTSGQLAVDLASRHDTGHTVSDSWSLSSTHSWSLFRTNVFAGGLQNVFDQVFARHSFNTVTCN